ncbi:SDR family oxidoreductase [Kineosporia babensis]|uniref:SDR family oxidoreductase n=1 Tax=Kineosporia babensis TaxID=499548 RepID=A0A9X1NIQ4_9ACTN|nr:SDR family oxidoreductase [Kineosporia babensis]MCD5315767.1 SDR family oxidoreductase [Kineosporia babensis]
MAPTVLVTGSSSGFGRSVAAKFLEVGWNVVATLRDPGRWTGETSERLLVHPLDVRDEEAVQAAVARAAEHFGRLDVVVNNAGIGLFAPFETTPVPMVQEVFDTNVFGPMHVVRAALPVFRAQGSGRIVNLSSGNATVPMPLQSVYSAAKGAVYNWSESLADELTGQNIQVKVVEPGFVPDTNFFAATYARFTGIPASDVYSSMIKATLDGFQVEPPPGYLATSQSVADTIFAAATDETGRLRYRIGSDSEELGRARQQPQAEYEAWRRRFFYAG